MDQKTSIPQVVIANRLTDGRVVFMTVSGDWVTDIAASHAVGGVAAAESLLARARLDEANNRVVDPCLIEVELVDGIPQPLSYREYIRAFGPSVPRPV